MGHHEDATIAPGSVLTPPAAPFTPGQVVAGRYRMVALLGRGGMGEVYRADDLTLGTTVAVKFLPSDVAQDDAALARFQSEVRIARQVSHPHVCRVFDIGTVEGRTFLTMEFVDGEDLATLLRRIGRLPAPKALELGRQICAGVAAAHEQGVLHRDLKPANIMVDGHGRARITDFGLAVISGTHVAEFAGTPAYMAPELLAGQAASTRSDLYALGLVLYEMFTGELPFRAHTLQEWRGAHTEVMPSPPSARVGDVDPLVERAILACLEKDPARRPRSAMALALALPGGDPLAAAVAAGETPSPEMVAAAGGNGATSQWLAAVSLGLTLLGLAGLLALSPYSTDLGLAPIRRTPDVLRDRAQTFARDFGYAETSVDSSEWLERDYGLLRWTADHLPSIDARQRLGMLGSPVLFTSRRADHALLPREASGLVTVSSPPVVTGSDDVRVVVDGAGRLRAFVATPTNTPAAVTSDAADLDALFRDSGLDRRRFTEVAPQQIPEVASDRRREWEGTREELPELPLRLSAAWFGQRLVWAKVAGPWDNSPAAGSTAGRGAIVSLLFGSMLLLMIGVAGVLVYRNVRAGRTDRRGAGRLAAIGAVASALIFLSSAHLAAGSPFNVASLFAGMAQESVVGAGYVWLIYMAIEPFARRRVPELLVGWARLLEGRWSDAAVARDVSIGLCAGVGLAVTMHLTNGLPSLIDLRGQTPVAGFTLSIYGGGYSRILPLPAIMAAVHDCISSGLAIFLVVVIARSLLPRRAAWLTTAVLLAVLLSGGENPWVEVPNAAVTGAMIAWIINGAGLLAFVTLWSSYRLLVFGASLVIYPTTWIAPYAWFTLALMAVLAVASYRLSLGAGDSAQAELL